MNSESNGMPRRIARGLIASALLALATPLAAAQDEKDTIVLKNGSTQTAKIVSEDYAGLKYANAKKQETALKWEEVSSVQFANAIDLYQARDAIDSGNSAEAIPKLDKLLADKKLRAPVKQEALFQYARAQRKLGQHEAAVTAYKELIKGFPSSKRLFAIGNGMTSLYLTRNDPGGAERALEELVSAANSAGVEGSFLAGFDVFRGRIHEARKRNPDAQTAYEKVLNAKGAPADAVAIAKLGVARMLQLGGKKTDAEQRYRDLVKERPAPAVLAGAWNGLGDLAYEDGLQRKSSDKLMEALQDYLHGVVIDVPPAGDPTDEYERALAGSAACWKALGEIETNADQKKSHLERARARVELLKAQFPSSRFLTTK